MMFHELTLMLVLLIGLANSLPFGEELETEMEMSQFQPGPVQFNADGASEATDAPPTPYGDGTVAADRVAGSQGKLAQESGFQCSSVYHGQTIAFQASYDKRNWLGCAPQTHCAKAGCPRLLMDPSDFVSCWGEVFRIYRQNGPGIVRVGDSIGIFYPQASKWFGCPGAKCDLRTCPGTPTQTYGFSESSKWGACWGEVFQVYALDKEIGDFIKNGDRIMLFYPKGKDWVGLVDAEPADHRTCPGTAFPPARDRYDECWGEVFEITVRDD